MLYLFPLKRFVTSGLMMNSGELKSLHSVMHHFVGLLKSVTWTIFLAFLDFTFGTNIAVNHFFLHIISFSIQWKGQVRSSVVWHELWMQMFFQLKDVKWKFGERPFPPETLEFLLLENTELSRAFHFLAVSDWAVCCTLSLKWNRRIILENLSLSVLSSITHKNIIVCFIWEILGDFEFPVLKLFVICVEVFVRMIPHTCCLVLISATIILFIFACL